MAAATSTVTTIPHYLNTIVGTNVDAGNVDYYIPYKWLKNGFSIQTGTLTAMTVTIRAANATTATSVDITSDVTGSASLSSDTGYSCDVNLAYNFVIIRYARTNATNAVDVSVFAPYRV